MNSNKYLKTKSSQEIPDLKEVRDKEPVLNGVEVNVPGTACCLQEVNQL